MKRLSGECRCRVREYCVRLLRGSKANAPDANQAASATIVPMRVPTGPSIKPGDRRNVFQFLAIGDNAKPENVPSVPGFPGFPPSFWRLAIMRNRKTFRLSPDFVSPGF